MRSSGGELTLPLLRDCAGRDFSVGYRASPSNESEAQVSGK